MMRQPQVAMHALINFLHRWQTLVGAFLGGVFSLCVALLVASKARRREEEAAATLLIGEIQLFRSAWTALSEIVKKRELEADQVVGIASRLTRVRPQLSPLFDASMARVVSVDQHLAAFLTLFRQEVRIAEQIFARIQELEEIIKVQGPEHFILELRRNLERATRRLQSAVKYADQAVPLLESLFLGRIPTFRRMARNIWTPKSEKDFLQGKDDVTADTKQK